MADKLGLAGVADEPSALNIFSLLERVSGIMDNVQACQQRMEERQLELENAVKTIQTDVVKLTKEHTATSGSVEKLLEKTRKVSCHIKDVRVRVEKQNVRVKKVEETQVELLNKNKFRVVIYQVRLMSFLWHVFFGLGFMVWIPKAGLILETYNLRIVDRVPVLMVFFTMRLSYNISNVRYGPIKDRQIITRYMVLHDP